MQLLRLCLTFIPLTTRLANSWQQASSKNSLNNPFTYYKRSGSLSKEFLKPVGFGMAFITSLLALTVQVNNTLNSNIPNIQAIASSYFKNCAGITILIDEHTEWETFHLRKPVIIQTIGSNFSDPETIPGIILHSKELFQGSIMSGVMWNADTKVLVINETGCSEDAVAFLWKRRVCNLLIFKLSPDKLEVCTVKESYCPYEKPKLSPKAYDANKEYQSHILSPTLNGCTLQISFLDLPPYVLTDGETYMAGNEGEIVSMALLNLGLNMTFKNQFQTGWGTFEPPTKLIGDVHIEESFMGFGGLFPLQERFIKGTPVYFCLPMHLGFTVPVGAGPHHPTSLVILISEFSLLVWIAVITSYFVLYPTAFGVEHFLNKWEQKEIYNIGLPLMVFQLILGYPSREFNSRLIMMTIILYGFLISTMYKSIMSSKLTAPAKIPEITTLKGILDSGMEVTGPLVPGQVLKSNGESHPYLKALSDKYILNSSDTSDLLRTLVEKRNSAVFRHTLHIIYTSLLDPALTGNVHLLEEKGVEFFSIAMLKKNSCFFRKVTRKFSQICEGGFVSKSLKDASETRGGDGSTGPRKLNLHDIKGFIYLALFGWSVSLVAFCIEMTIFHFSNVKQVALQ